MAFAPETPDIAAVALPSLDDAPLPPVDLPVPPFAGRDAFCRLNSCSSRGFEVYGLVFRFCRLNSCSLLEHDDTVQHNPIQCITFRMI